ncbi:4-amino-4-deoxy-L-arabinose transferase-like glycosyltransferase [Parabacteroides sp. PF5-5]|uniref:ArnT family glycosyltransferase n=1 Tax=unclassified Parabacteroides TaxID=2649774 RepID=UPI00247586DE|nr:MULTISPECIES: glycosyltransferase family 39 protein [unclassified Parabacteroides]MDH6303976.1 4-amino-4-deoxy-L-arabinose transferase-like glycosyltransferase [Parabacteroides sp. PH5-39]MDH6314592.1 4-amino-4-deoxy-L-arabinose transferase-like glycosyltransferase [Parabacteroides sp. PF5-13]MDH6318343.1 4-amino-4-deoxy-L-arabinose transferase-like glycosyltransferase [Parabacteroides sp. PH5-13]MDH6322365.1 4-amino-4-deoxy-L-arabinose transferase-like glycosyltransferase [Parabacteroides s
MRTPFLQYLYLQKPVTMAIIICAISVLPWIGLWDFSANESREAGIAASILETGNCVLPTDAEGELAYTPPMLHWLIAAFSLPQGHVSEFTARLPSALALIVLIGFTLFFFGERIKFQEAFICTFLLLTCIEVHKAGMIAGTDMLFTAFIVIALYMLYRWENKLELKGLPISIPILIGCAVLTKGLTGILLPLLVFGVYLVILKKHRTLTIIKALIYAGVASSFLPLIWYAAVWRQAGDQFFNVLFVESSEHVHGIWYYFGALLGGFMPWTLFFFFSLFGLKLRWPQKFNIRSLDKIKMFSLVALVCIFFFYFIPSGKKSAFLLPAYPFIAVFLAQYTIYITEYRMLVTRIFVGFLSLITLVILTTFVLTITHVIDPVSITAQFTSNPLILNNATLVKSAVQSPDLITTGIVLIVLAALVTVIYQMFKKINLKMLYATIFLAFAVNLMVDGIFIRNIKSVETSNYSFTTSTSISTNPFLGNVFTATAERAGKLPSN